MSIKICEGLQMIVKETISHKIHYGIDCVNELQASVDLEAAGAGENGMSKTTGHHPQEMDSFFVTVCRGVAYVR